MMRWWHQVTTKRRSAHASSLWLLFGLLPRIALECRALELRPVQRSDRCGSFFSAAIGRGTRTLAIAGEHFDPLRLARRVHVLLQFLPRRVLGKAADPDAAIRGMALQAVPLALALTLAPAFAPTLAAPTLAELRLPHRRGAGALASRRTLCFPHVVGQPTTTHCWSFSQKWDDDGDLAE